jgi:hypothetical protein
MSNYRKTMTEALREMYPLNEGTIDKVKEIASKKQAMKIDGVMVDSFTASAISQIYDKVNDATKKKMEKLPITKLANLAMKMMQKNEFVPEEVDLDEAKIDPTAATWHQLVAPKSAKVIGNKEDGYRLRMFFPDGHDETLPEIGRPDMNGLKSIIDKNILKHKKGIRKSWIPVVSAAMKKKPIDEGTKQVLAHGGKGQYKAVRDGSITKVMYKGKVVGTADFDRGADSFFASIKGEKGQKSFDDAQAMVDYFAKNKITEEVELDESEFSAMAYGKKDQRFVVKPRDTKGMKGKQDKFKMYVATLDNKGREKEIIKDLGTHVSLDSAIKFAKNRKIIEDVELDEGFSPKEIKMAIGIASDKRYAGGNMTGAVAAIDKIKKGLSDHPQVAAVLRRQNEEVDLDEKVKEYKGVAYFKTRKDAEEHMKKFASKGRVVEYERGYAVQTRTSGPYLNKAGKTEEFELDEGKMSQLHQYIKDKKSPEEIAKLMKLDVKTIKALMNSHHPEEVEESAAADARRAMRRDKDFSRRDSADDDTDATDDDIKGASKNIMMQMRKAQSLASGGKFKVEFGDGKKVKIPANMAIAVQQKYNSMRKPADKEKFQARIGKSYKDMLSALKEELQPKKESILERMNRKIKENKDG